MQIELLFTKISVTASIILTPARSDALADGASWLVLSPGRGAARCDHFGDDFAVFFRRTRKSRWNITIYCTFYQSWARNVDAIMVLVDGTMRNRDNGGRNERLLAK